MHIGIDARLTYYRVGGISTYIRAMVKTLETLDSGNQYTIFHSRKASESITTRFQRAPLWTPSHHRIERLALAVELTRFRLDIFHTTDFIPPLWGAKHHVVSIYDLTFLIYPQYITAETRRYYNDQIHAAAAKADHILTISTASKHDIVERLGVPSEKVTVQWCGVEPIFQPLPKEKIDAAHREYDLPESYILFVGTLEPRKNLVTLAKAYQELLANCPDAPPLLLVGKPGWLYDDLMRDVAAVGLDDRHLLVRHNVSHDLLPAVYNGASLLVLPSHYEGFGLPPLEAMACGIIPIVSNRSSLPEVVGEVGLQIDPDDPSMLAAALQKALSDTTWRAEMRPKALAQAARFNWERTAQIALSVYHQVSA
ncbi:MAG: glycosyltransferase family 1 protein [Anaerolineae bacterium]